MGHSPWGCKELDRTEQLYTHTHTHTHTQEQGRAVGDTNQKELFRSRIRAQGRSQPVSTRKEK